MEDTEEENSPRSGPTEDAIPSNGRSWWAALWETTGKFMDKNP